MESSTPGRIDSETDRQPIRNFRRVLPQILAISAINLVKFNIGLIRSFATILIAALEGLNAGRNPNEFIKISPSDSTWLASVYTLCLFFGNFIFTFLSEPLGRKKSIIFINIPIAIGWIMLSYSKDLPIIFVSSVILCLSVSFALAPVHNYIGEICEPDVRGILTATNCIAVALGYLLNYSLANMLPWRTMAFIYIAMPVASAVTMFFIPESPPWLLLRNREAHAEKSLRWLRGWVNEDAVRDEFSDFKRFQAIAQQCCECEKHKVTCIHPPPSISDQIRQLLHQRTFRPLVLMFILYFLAYFSSSSAIRPYYVQVFYYYESPIDPNLAVSYAGWVDVVSSITAVIAIRSFGKRKVYFWSLAFSILFTFAIGIYGIIFLSNDITSFEIKTDSYLRSGLNEHFRYIPLILIFLLMFVFTFGVILIPWCMVCEVFPLRSKGFAIGLTLSIENAVSFTSSKTFYSLEVWLTLPGVLFFYGTIAVVGFIGLYFTMPETEGRTLEEIEHFFSNTQRKLYDIDIPKMSKGDKNHHTTESIE